MKNDQEQANKHNNNDLQHEKKTNNFIKIRKSLFALIILIVIIVSSASGLFISSFTNQQVEDKTNNFGEFNKLFAVYNNLVQMYFQDLDTEKLIDGAITGMIDSLDDPYSQYMDKKEAQSFHDSINSSFEGIGAEVQELDGFIVVVSPIKGSPAEKAGLLPNDRVLTADGNDLRGLSATEAVNYIRGKKGTTVKLTIDRPGLEDTIDVEIVRDTIPIETVYSEMIEDGIGKVQITSFSENTTKELIEELTNLKQQGLKGIILDLRHNPGGLLPRAIEITSLFVPEGKVIFKVEDKDGNIEQFKSTKGDKVSAPLVVLINKGSASASEILAGAVKESGKAPLVGETTFGKGTVQNAHDLNDGSNMKITTAKWLTPNGNWIHEKGIKPDYEVALPDYATLPFINPDLKLKLSTTSFEVKVAQQMLAALDYNVGSEDGLFGPSTELAVKQLQKDCGLDQTGVLTGETTLKMMELLREKILKDDPQLEKAIEVLKTLINNN